MTIACEKARGLEVAWSGDVPRLVPSAGGIVRSRNHGSRIKIRNHGSILFVSTHVYTQHQHMHTARGRVQLSKLSENPDLGRDLAGKIVRVEIPAAWARQTSPHQRRSSGWHAKKRMCTPPTTRSHTPTRSLGVCACVSVHVTGQSSTSGAPRREAECTDNAHSEDIARTKKHRRSLTKQNT